jgi:yecA family protein
MLRNPRRAVSKHRAAVEAVMPPDLHALGELPFGPAERERLQEWLAEGGWPRACMEMEMLEGYLIALLVWPVGLPSGAWLPTIWGERGWKIPAKLADPEVLDKFVALVAGFLQDLDRRLCTVQPPYVVVVDAPGTASRRQRYTGCNWAVGFMNALEQNSHGLQYRSEEAKAAATVIARWSSVPAAPATGAELTRAVYALAGERLSRGPLGPLRSSNPASSHRR